MNAWATPETGEVFVTKALLETVGPQEGELAFILNHELAHIYNYWWWHPESLQLRLKVSRYLFPLGPAVLSKVERRNRDSQVDETMADLIAFGLLIDSGHNPYDAAAFFGRLQMYEGTAEPTARLWAPYFRTHPFNENRIQILRAMLPAFKEGIPSKRLDSNASASPTYAWFVKFQMVLQTTDGQQMVVGRLDSLGVYREDEFTVIQEAAIECAQRRLQQLIRSTQPEVKAILEITVSDIEREPLPDQPRREKWQRSPAEGR